MFTFLSRSFQSILSFTHVFRDSYGFNYRAKMATSTKLTKPTSHQSGKYIYVAFPDRSVYLKEAKLSEIESESRKLSNKITRSAYFDGRETILHMPNISVCDNKSLYTKSAIASYGVYRELSKSKSCIASHCVEFSSFSENEGCFKRGVCLSASSDEDVKDSDIYASKLSSMNLITYDLGVKSGKDNESLFFIRKLRSDSDDTDGDNETVYQVVDRASICLESHTVGQDSPIFSVPELMPVFHGLQRARAVLMQVN